MGETTSFLPLYSTLSFIAISIVKRQILLLWPSWKKKEYMPPFFSCKSYIAFIFYTPNSIGFEFQNRDKKDRKQEYVLCYNCTYNDISATNCMNVVSLFCIGVHKRQKRIAYGYKILKYYSVCEDIFKLIKYVGVPYIDRSSPWCTYVCSSKTGGKCFVACNTEDKEGGKEEKLKQMSFDSPLTVLPLHSIQIHFFLPSFLSICPYFQGSSSPSPPPPPSLACTGFFLTDSILFLLLGRLGVGTVATIVAVSILALLPGQPVSQPPFLLQIDSIRFPALPVGSPLCLSVSQSLLLPFRAS